MLIIHIVHTISIIIVIIIIIIYLFIVERPAVDLSLETIASDQVRVNVCFEKLFVTVIYSNQLSLYRLCSILQ